MVAANGQGDLFSKWNCPPSGRPWLAARLFLGSVESGSHLYPEAALAKR